MRIRDRRGAAALTMIALLVVGGCASGPATTRSVQGEGASASDRVGAPGLEALRTKIGFFTRDPCASGDAAEVFARCGRFTTEVRNAIGQVRRDAPDATPQADATEQALGRFAETGCEAAPGTVGEGDPAVCGPAFAAVQDAVQGMADAVGPAR